LNDDFREDEMGSAYSRHGKEEECLQGFGGEVRKRKTTRKVWK
jgi:hypothetical protein